MSLETGTYVQDLVSTNPVSGDAVSQGDDHLRLLKAILKATFPNASRAWYMPTTQSKSADFTVVAADMFKTFLVDTSGGVVTATLPTLASTDAGWACYFYKSTTDINSLFTKAASGNVISGTESVAQARRCIPRQRFEAFWDGSNWRIARIEKSPIGTVLDYSINALPVGYEYPNGQTLSTTNYPEYASVKGSGATVDLRGRVVAGTDTLGTTAASRLTGAQTGGCAGTFGASGGEQGHTDTVAEMPNHRHGGSVTNTDLTHTHSSTADDGFFSTGLSGSGGTALYRQGGGAGLTSTLGGPSISLNHSHNISFEGGGAAHNNVQPTFVMNKILVVE